MNVTKPLFDHEKLIAYRRSLQFIAWCSPLLEKLPPKLAVTDQLDRASTSIPLNIAEGNAKYTAPDRCRYLDTARGSALECAACLDVLVAKGKFTTDEVQAGKDLLCETVCLLVGLIRSIAADRLSEGSVENGMWMERKGLEPIVYEIKSTRGNRKRDGKRSRRI
jgi:four helix bundle protein